MATPANRVPVRIARGSKANLDTAIAAGDLKEGEICYATDENGIYVIEGGTLTQAGADLASTSIDALSDVDTTTATPTDGQALVWNNSVSQWEPGGVSGEIEWTLTANGTTDYIFAGAGFAGTETDPDIYVMRGQTYKFTNAMGAHPFQIQSTQGTSGTAYNDGITNNGVSNGTLTWEVRMDAPSTLYYQCTSHALMAGVIYVLDEGSTVASIDDLSDVDTSTVAPTDGQALVWDNANSKWEPGTVSGGGGTTLPSGTTDGEALIWENGAWAVGPAIGGVNYTPSNADANFSNVELLLLGNGANGSTTFTDSSSNARTATVSGNTQISTTQSKFGGSSIYFDGTGDYLEFAPDADLIDWHTGGAFTVEAWVYASSWTDWSASSTAPSLCGNSSATSLTGYWTFGPNASGNVVFQYWNGSTVALTGATALTTGAWHHIAMSYDGTTIRVFADGVLDASNTVSGTPQTSLSYNFTVGSLDNYFITGYVDDLRVTQGTARYTATFTPPTAELPATSGTAVTIPYSIDKLDDVDTSTVAPTDGQALVWDNANSQWEPGTISSGTTLPAAADGEALIYEDGQWVAGPVIGGVSYTSAADPQYSNVQLLLHCNGTNGSTTFTDSSQNGLTVNANNNAQISTAQFKFGGASAYFDGTDDTLGVNSSLIIIGTGQFTLELWYYASSLDGGIVRTGSNVAGSYELGLYTSGLIFWTYADGNVLTTTAPSLNAWHHVAITRDSSDVLRMFVDGVLADSTTGFTSNLYKNSLVIGTSRTNYYDFEGYIDDFRLTTGVARYTAAFTPPTAQLPGAGSPVTIPYSIDKLDDVDTSTVAPTDGQALVWDNANSKWEPGTVGGSVASIDDIGDVDTSTVAPTDGQALLWDNTAQKWEPGTVSGGGGTTLPAAQDGEALIYENGQWVAGPVIGGVNYASAGGPTYTVPTGFALWSDTFTIEPASQSSTVILTNGDRTAEQTGSVSVERNAASTSTKSTGKWYWEVTIDVQGTDSLLGITPNPASGFPGDSNTGGIGFYRSGQMFNNSGATVSSGSAFVTGDTLMLALDADAKKLWFGKNGTWVNSGDPAAGTGTAATNWTGTPDWYFACRFKGTGGEKYTVSSGANIVIPYSIDKLDDVDTSTVAPTDGQALLWDAANSKWEPGTVSGGGAVTSVNTQTGAVSLGIEDLDDFELNESSATSSVTRTPAPGSSSNAGSGDVGTSILSSGYTYWAYDPEGTSASNVLTYLRDNSLTYPLDIDINGTTIAVQGISTSSSSVLRLDHSGFTNANQITGSSWTLSLASAPIEPLADGDILQYNSADSKFKPVQLGVDNLSDVDTSTVAPTDGQALVWDNANSKWEPGTVSGGGGGMSRAQATAITLVFS